MIGYLSGIEANETRRNQQDAVVASSSRGKAASQDSHEWGQSGEGVALLGHSQFIIHRLYLP